MPQPKSKHLAKQPDPWAEHFQRALAQRCKQPTGEGWITRLQFSERAKICRNRANKYLTGEVKAGRMEKFEGGQFVGDKATRLTWYRPLV